MLEVIGPQLELMIFCLVEAFWQTPGMREQGPGLSWAQNSEALSATCEPGLEVTSG